MMNAQIISKKMSIVDQGGDYRDLFGQFAHKSSFDDFKEELFKIKKIVQDLNKEQNAVKQYTPFLRSFVQ